MSGIQHRKAFILSHLGLGDNIFCNGLVRHIYSLYEETVVVVKKHNADTVRELYSDLPNLLLHIVNHDKDISLAFGCPSSKYNSITQDYDVYLSGSHKKYNKADFKLFPLNFYDDHDLPRQYIWTKSIIPISPIAVKLYEKVKNIPYIFIHNNTSNGDIFKVHSAYAKFNIDKYETFIINPLKNMYEPGDSQYDLAQTFVNQPTILAFTYLLENSQMNILTDSSIFCLANLLEIKHSNNYVITRGITYKNLYDSNFYSDGGVSIKNKFIEITLP